MTEQKGKKIGGFTLRWLLLVPGSLAVYAFAQVSNNWWIDLLEPFNLTSDHFLVVGTVLTISAMFAIYTAWEIAPNSKLKAARSIAGILIWLPVVRIFIEPESEGAMLWGVDMMTAAIGSAIALYTLEKEHNGGK